MEAIVKDHREPEVYNIWSHEEMLRYSWQVSVALADVQNVGNIYGSPAIAHTDVDISQFLWIDNMFKVNLFSHFSKGYSKFSNIFILPISFDN